MREISLRRFRLISIISLVLGIGWIGLSATFPGGLSEKGIPAPQESFLAPDFTLESLDGNSINLSEFHGQPVLVNFWASWCRPCQSEMSAMERVYEEYVNKGFVILAVNTTFQDNPDEVKAFALEYGLTFPILLDVDRTVSAQYQLHALPSTFFIDREGIIQEVIFGGPIAEALLRIQVEKLLEEIP